jgi:hypothetical protein
VRLYIAGPMTGLDNYNYPAFNEAAQLLSSAGHEVYNPASAFNGRTDLDYKFYLKDAIAQVLLVEGIVLLPGWVNSRGALTECMVGLALDHQFFRYQDGFLIPFVLDYAEVSGYLAEKYCLQEVA